MGSSLLAFEPGSPTCKFNAITTELSRTSVVWASDLQVADPGSNPDGIGSGIDESGE